jgi:glycogen synthase
MRNCMTSDFSWKSSASSYREIYMDLMGRLA